MRLNSAGLDEAIRLRLVGSPMPSGERLLGIEVERLILHRETRANAPLAFCRQLLADLVGELGAVPTEDGGVLHKMQAAGFGLSMEPGGQIEVDSEPCRDLAALEALIRVPLRAIEARLAETPYALFSLGHAPVTPVADLGLLPRQRYLIMDREMPARGALSRNMMRATAGLQVSFDFADADDAAAKLALLYRLVPLLAALTANSRFAGGEDTGFASFRHRVWWDTDTVRSGVPEGTLDAETAIDGYVRFARRAIVLFQRENGGLVAAPRRPLEDLVAAGGVTESDLDLHLTSLFPFVRLRNYLEVRCLDTVDWPLARSVLALVSGLVYCGRAFAQAQALSEQLVVRDPVELRALHLAAAKDGLDARAPSGVTLRELAGELIGFSARKLGSEDCDWAGEADLDAVRARVAG